MSVKLLTEHDLMFLSLKGGCTGSSESTLVKMPHCWKTHAVAQIFIECDPVTVVSDPATVVTESCRSCDLDILSLQKA